MTVILQCSRNPTVIPKVYSKDTGRTLQDPCPVWGVQCNTWSHWRVSVIWLPEMVGSCKINLSLILQDPIFRTVIWLNHPIPTALLIPPFDTFASFDRLCIYDPVILFFPALLSSHIFVNISSYKYILHERPNTIRTTYLQIILLPRASKLRKFRHSHTPEPYEFNSIPNCSTFPNPFPFLLIIYS